MDLLFSQLATAQATYGLTQGRALPLSLSFVAGHTFRHFWLIIIQAYLKCKMGGDNFSPF